MASIRLSVQLIDTNNKIEGDINKEITRGLNKLFLKSSKVVEIRVRALVRSSIINSTTYNSLVSNGILAGELGIPDASAKINSIVDKWISSIRVENKPIKINGVNFSGGLQIKLIQGDFEDVLALPEASYTDTKKHKRLSQSSESSLRSIYTIPWLRWLLLEGDSVLVRDFDVEIAGPKNKPRNRSGLVMKRRPGARWRIPSEFSGTEQNNFVTRALSDIDKQIDLIVRQEIVKNGFST